MSIWLAITLTAAAKSTIINAAKDYSSRASAMSYFTLKGAVSVE